MGEQELFYAEERQGIRMSAKISGIIEGSPAYEAGLEAGDVIESINGIEIRDYLDYMYASCGEEAEVLLVTGEKTTIENEDFLPLGIEFETMLIDKPRACRNRCVFCFIDQLPKGMRDTCYFKDDDYRLSFLQGNYVSMTNMTDDDVERILKYHIPRINISVHTTNPELRQKMLNNKNAGKVLEYLRRFADGGLNMNGQIVLCPGYNDKDELDRTIGDLKGLAHSMESLSVVPVGLSRHRDGLTPLRGFDKESSAEVIRQVEKWQKKFLSEIGRRFVYLGDEFYIMAGYPVPGYDTYEGFPQIENGVGLCASLLYEFDEALKMSDTKNPKQKKSVATGKISYDIIKEMVNRLDGDNISVYPIENDFFGKNITVSGLITGGDIIKQLKGKPLGEELLITSSALRRGEDVFLDDMTLAEVEDELGVRVRAVENDGFAFLNALLD